MRPAHQHRLRLKDTEFPKAEHARIVILIRRNGAPPASLRTRSNAERDSHGIVTDARLVLEADADRGPIPTGNAHRTANATDQARVNEACEPRAIEPCTERW